MKVTTSNYITVVIDDDPTGIQTVHDVPVYMEWSEETVDSAIASGYTLCFFQTNSRALGAAATQSIHIEIMTRLLDAADKYGKEIRVMSRGDSTLRGHYPLEPLTLRNVWEQKKNVSIDGEIFVPCFPEGGRVTEDDIHYVMEGYLKTPVGETEYAQDTSFGFTSSNLKDYIREKYNTPGYLGEIHSIPKDWLLNNNVNRIQELLQSVHNYAKIIVNASTYGDLGVLAQAVHQTEALGKRFLFRTASAFVKAYARLEDRPLLSKEDLTVEEGPGLVIIGSHTSKTTEQLHRLSTNGFNSILELEVSALLGNQQKAAEMLNDLTEKLDAMLDQGQTSVLMTSRQLIKIKENSNEVNLSISQLTSKAIIDIVAGLKNRPSYVVVKGGITSSDVAVKALKVKQALVQGQILPGIPVITTGIGSKWPGLPYVIFPGNVGTPDDLLNVIQILTGHSTFASDINN